MRRRRVIVAHTVAALVTMLAPACTSRKHGQGDAVRLIHLMWGAPNEVEQVDRWIGEFHKRHPHIRVKNVHVPRNYSSKLTTMLVGGTPPDVAFCNQNDFSYFVRKEALLDLTPFIERDGHDLTGFYPRLIAAYQLDGRQCGIPRSCNTCTLYYNCNMFDAEGVEYPNAQWTWRDFTKAAKELTRDLDGDGRTDQYGCDIRFYPLMNLPVVWQHGGRLFSRDGTRFLLTDPKHHAANVRAYQMLLDIIHVHRCAPTMAFLQESGGGFITTFQKGVTAMYFSGQWQLIQLREVKDFRWNLAVLPSNNGQRANILQSTCYIIPKKSSHHAEAWELLKFVTSEYANRDIARMGRCIPPRRAVAESALFLQSEGLPEGLNLRAAIAPLEYAQPMVYGPESTLAYKAFQEEMERASLQLCPLEQAFQRAQRRVDEILAEAQ